MREPEPLVVRFGSGSFSVGSGTFGGVPALALGDKGSGVVGEPTPLEALSPDLLVIMAFSNVESLDVVAHQLAEVRELLTGEKTVEDHRAEHEARLDAWGK